MKKIIILPLVIASLTLLHANEDKNPAQILEEMYQKMQQIAFLEKNSTESNSTVTKEIKTDNNETNTIQTIVTENNQTEEKNTTLTKIEEPFNYNLKPKQISDNVWCFLGLLEGPSAKNAGAMSNSCWIQTDDSYVLLDSGPSYEYARQSYEAMKKIKDLPVSTVFISHDHDDHWLGNNFYKEEFNATLIGPELVNTNYKDGDKTRMFEKLPANAIKGTKIVKLDETPKETIKRTIGGEDFEFVAIPTKAHTPTDFFLYMPKRKILFTGDVAMNGRVTSNRDGSLMGQLKAIEMIRAKEWNNLVAGHGFITDKTALDEADRYFNLMYEAVKKALDNDEELTDLVPNEIMKEFKDKAMFNALNGQNFNEAYTELDFLED